MHEEFIEIQGISSPEGICIWTLESMKPRWETRPQSCEIEVTWTMRLA
jgi:hypothetical protein